MDASRPTRPPYPLVAGVLALVLMAGCSFNPQRPGADAFDPRALSPSSVEVVNRGWSPMAIYAFVGSGRYRLGSVAGASSERIRVPDEWVRVGATFHLVAQGTSGGAEVWSPAFELEPSRRITWTIEEDPDLSHLRVR